MYKRLRAFQSVVIPVCYGEARCDDVPALLLSDIGGFPLCDPRAALIKEDDLLRMFYGAFGALAKLGILHDDAKLDIYHLVGNKTMIVDLEQADKVKPDEIEFLVNSTIRTLYQSTSRIKHALKRMVSCRYQCYFCRELS